MCILLVKTVKPAGLTSLTSYLKKLQCLNCIYMTSGEVETYFVVEFVLLQRLKIFRTYFNAEYPG